jgi:signal transduction histidine kinase
MDNLVSNALKHGARSPIGIAASARGDQVCVEVRDGGGGIPVADRQRVFQRFERAVGRGERRSGFGLGLWVVRELVEAMAGTITLGDAPGGGALFTVTLPRHARPLPAQDAPA